MESANIVGYMDVAKKSGYNFAGGGSMFVTPGATSYSLAQLAITGPANKNVARMNYIQFMAAGTAAKLDATKSYYYFGGKWYSRTGTSAVTDPEVSDPTSVTVSAGQGFLTCLPFATAKITYNGEVITGTDKAITIEKPTGYNFFIAANPCASEISLSDITITGPGNKNIARMNYIQSFAAGTAAKLDATKSYYYFGGKWYSRTGTSAVNDPEVTDPSTIKLASGEGVLCCLPLATAKINFPTSL